jgi:hypothetical protein
MSLTDWMSWSRSPKDGKAALTLDDGTVIQVERSEDAGNPGAIAKVSLAEIPDCSECFASEEVGGIRRLHINTDGASTADITLEDVLTTSKARPHDCVSISFVFRDHPVHRVAPLLYVGCGGRNALRAMLVRRRNVSLSSLTSPSNVGSVRVT